MTDEDRDEDDEKDEKEEQDESASDEQKWKRAYLRRLAEGVTKKFEKGRRVDKGFEGAFGGQENAHKYYRKHEFKYAAEPKDKVPESRPLGLPPEGFTEPSRYKSPKSYVAESKNDDEAEQRLEMMSKFYKILNDPELVNRLLRGEKLTDEIDILEKPGSEHGRRSDGAHNPQISKEKVDYNETLDGREDSLAVEIDAPRSSANQAASEVSSQLEKEGFEQVSDESSGEDSISPLELGEIHEQLRTQEIEGILEEKRQELLGDFEIEPPIHDDNMALTEASTYEAIPEPLATDPLGNPLKPKPEIEDAEME